jgi:DNA topoisomerase IA
MRDKSKVIKELREAAKYSSEIILASDPTAKEAIAWHILTTSRPRPVQTKDRGVP